MKRGILDRIIGLYSAGMVKVPMVVLVLALICMGLAFNSMQNLGTEEMDHDTILPSDLPVMEGFDIIKDNFGGSSSVKLAVMVDRPISNESVADVKDVEVLKYMEKLGVQLEKLQYVNSVSSPSSRLKELNDGVLPKRKSEVLGLMEKDPRMETLVNEESSVARITVDVVEGFDAEFMMNAISMILRTTDQPDGVRVELYGNEISNEVVNSKLSADMNRTSMISMIGIVVVLLLIFGSLFYGLVPLTTIVFGVVFTMGFVSFIGMGISSATSGVLSMIMGIGIDFGIQLVNRFREEMKNLKVPERAMSVTLSSVIKPMATTTIAAVIGFTAMRMGTITVLSDMGVMLTYGVTFCFVAAITVLPSLLIVFERVKGVVGIKFGLSNMVKNGKH